MPHTLVRELLSCTTATQPVQSCSEPAHQYAERDIAKIIVEGQLRIVNIRIESGLAIFYLVFMDAFIVCGLFSFFFR